MDGWNGEQTDGRMDGWIYGWMEWRTDGRMDGWMAMGGGSIEARGGREGYSEQTKRIDNKSVKNGPLAQPPK